MGDSVYFRGGIGARFCPHPGGFGGGMGDSWLNVGDGIGVTFCPRPGGFGGGMGDSLVNFGGGIGARFSPVGLFGGIGGCCLAAGIRICG